MNEGDRVVSMYGDWYPAFGDGPWVPLSRGQKLTIARRQRSGGALFFAFEEMGDDSLLYLASGFRPDAALN